MNSLKDLKDALNKIDDDETLDNFYITHQMWLEDGEAEIGLTFQCDEEDYDKHNKLLETEGMEVMSEFAKQITEDVKKVVICQIDEEKYDDYMEDAPSER